MRGRLLAGYTALAVAGGALIACGPTPLPNPPHPDDPGGRCERAHGFPPIAPPPTMLTGTDCPPAGCGLNGVWMGAGVSFRTLHQSPRTPNKEGVSILGFRQGSDDLFLAIDMNTDQLIGRAASGASLTGPALIGAVITLGTGSPPVPAYEVTIRDVKPALGGYWVDCPGCAAPWLYSFEAIDLHDRCVVRLCQPGLDDNPPAGLVGRAVIFRGDYYDERTHGVTTTPDPLNPDGQDDVFNVACLGTAISKLHMLRHTSASRTTAAVPQRRALLQAITADYCGDGSSFTQDGHRIQLAFNPATYGSPYTPTPGSQYGLTGTSTAEAAWTVAGARCIGTARLLSVPPASRPGLPGTTAADLRNEVNAACGKRKGTAPTAIPDCAPAVSPTTPFGLGNDILSANPQ